MPVTEKTYLKLASSPELLVQVCERWGHVFDEGAPPELFSWGRHQSESRGPI
jgi:hypothetical protein